MQCILKAVDSTHQSALKFTSNFMSDGSVGRTIRAASLWHPSIKAHFFSPKAPAILPSASEVEKENRVTPCDLNTDTPKWHPFLCLIYSYMNPVLAGTPLFGNPLTLWNERSKPGPHYCAPHGARAKAAYISLRHAILNQPLGPAGCGGAHAISVVASIE